MIGKNNTILLYLIFVGFFFTLMYLFLHTGVPLFYYQCFFLVLLIYLFFTLVCVFFYTSVSLFLY